MKNMTNKAMEYSLLSDGCSVLTDEELNLVLGADGPSVDFSNSGDYRNGVVQMAATVGGLVAAGIAIVSAPISFPLALAGAAAAGIAGGFSMADAQIDMRNAQPDPPRS
jgi:hypothetical protein